MKIALLYNNFFDLAGQTRIVGGIETYLLNLARLCRNLGFDTTIYQWADRSFERFLDDICIKGKPVYSLPHKRRNSALYQAAAKEIDLKRDIVIFGADHKTVPTTNPRHISIQHGVSWDLPAIHLSRHRIVKYQCIGRIVKLRMANLARQNFSNCRNVVCVDYNFLNWYRTIISKPEPSRRIWVVPNFAEIAPEEDVKKRNYNNNIINILFARRFVQIRGTRIISETAKKLLSNYRNICFTFAGQGPEEKWMRQQFGSDNRVRFIAYLPDETMKIHLNHDIAVVPSLASEGTSLSVAEAMATACPVVATATGGVTNMIINGYNGLLVMPDPESLHDALENLIRNASLRRHLGLRAYDTARQAFSITSWQKSWRSILEQVSDLKGF